MKIKPEHYEELRKVILAVHRPHLQKVYQENGLFEARYAWDCLWAAKLDYKIYEYLNDSHIETAIKKIIREINKEVTP